MLNNFVLSLYISTFAVMRSTHITYKIWAVFLSFFILISSVDFSVDLHFCKKELRNISFSLQNEADVCEQTQKSCCSISKEIAGFQLSKHCDCCSTNTITHHSISSTLSDVATQIKKNITSDAIIEKVFCFGECPRVITTQKQVSFLNYTSVLLTTDIVILVERFLC